MNKAVPILCAALLTTARANANTIIEHANFWALGSGLSEPLGLTPHIALADFNPDLGALRSATVEITGYIFPTVSSLGGSIGPPPYSVTLVPTVYLRGGATGDHGSGAFSQMVHLEPQTAQDPLSLLSPVGVSVQSELIDVSFSLSPAAVTSSVPFSGDLSPTGVWVFADIGTTIDHGYTGFSNLDLVDGSYGNLTVTVTYTYDPVGLSSLPEPSTALLLGPVLFVLRRIRRPINRVAACD